MPGWGEAPDVPNQLAYIWRVWKGGTTYNGITGIMPPHDALGIATVEAPSGGWPVGSDFKAQIVRGGFVEAEQSIDFVE